MKNLFLLIVLIYFCNGIAVPAQQLQGKISINIGEKIKPLDPLLCPGNYFDEKVATALLKDKSVDTSTWEKIPAWQAGDWESTQATCTKSVDYINGRPSPRTPSGVYISKCEGSHGWQKDKNGDSWEWYHSGHWAETKCDDYVIHAFIKFLAPGTNEYPDLYDESINFYVDKATNKITDVWQCKQWSRYVYLAPGLFKEEAVHTAYNEKGKPLSSAWNTTLERQTKTFAENEIIIASDTKLRQNFFNYLKNNGLANLIPIAKSNPSRGASTEKVVTSSAAKH